MALPTPTEGAIAELPGEPVTPSRAATRRGVFKDGVWYCECVPALPCLILKASNVKDKKNSGREFLRCQKDKKTKNSCDFYLWVDQARSREINYLMTNRRSEGKGPRLTQSQLPFKPLASTSSAGADGGGNNRKSMRLQAKLGNMPIRSRNADGTSPAATAVAGPSSSRSDTARRSDDDGDDGGRRSSTPTRSARRVPPGDDGKGKNNSNNNDTASSLSSSRTASSRTLRSSGSQQQQEQQQQSQPDATSKQHVSAKRKKASTDNDEFSDFSDGEVRELAAIELRSGGSTAGGGAVRTRNAFITPTVSGGRSIFAAHYHDGSGGGGLPTPATERSVRRVLFAPTEQQQQQSQQNKGKDAAATGLQTTSTSKRQRNTAQGAYTPSSSSSAAHLRTPGTSFSSDTSVGDITTDIMDMLQRSGGSGGRGSRSKVGIDPAVLDGVRGVLDMYSRRTAGFERGRDLSRREIQRQQRRIAELELRNAALENSRDLDRAALRSARRRGDVE